MNSTHNYEQLIEIFDSCFADDFNTRLIKGDDEPIYLPACLLYTSDAADDALLV